MADKSQKGANPESPANMNRVAVLGPHGTFTEEAFLSQADLAGAELFLCPTITAVFSSVSDGTAGLGFVALENSIEGGINITLDSLAFDSDLLIQREVIVGVHLHLLGLEGTELGKIRQVLSFPQAIAQSRKWLEENLPGVETHVADSTAEAARIVAEGGDVNAAAIATARAGELHKLKTLAQNVEEHPENKTRFIAVGKGQVPKPSGHDKTSIVVFQRANRPGSLLTILQEFSARSINLTRLESRPTKEALGNYCFLMDFQGHIQDEMVADCLINIRQKHADIKFLGSYPAAGEEAEEIGTQQQVERDNAREWLSTLRDQIG